MTLRRERSLPSKPDSRLEEIFDIEVDAVDDASPTHDIAVLLATSVAGLDVSELVLEAFVSVLSAAKVVVVKDLIVDGVGDSKAGVHDSLSEFLTERTLFGDLVHVMSGLSGRDDELISPVEDAGGRLIPSDDVVGETSSDESSLELITEEQRFSIGLVWVAVLLYSELEPATVGGVVRKVLVLCDGKFEGRVQYMW